MGRISSQSQGTRLQDHPGRPQEFGARDVELPANARRNCAGDEGGAVVNWNDLCGEIDTHIEERLWNSSTQGCQNGKPGNGRVANLATRPGSSNRAGRCGAGYGWNTSVKTYATLFEPWLPTGYSLYSQWCRSRLGLGLTP